MISDKVLDTSATEIATGHSLTRCHTKLLTRKSCFWASRAQAKSKLFFQEAEPAPDIITRIKSFVEADKKGNVSLFHVFSL